MPKWKVILCAMQLSMLSLSGANSQQPVTGEDRERIVDEICGILREHYVYPQVAESIAERLRKSLRDGVYDSASDNAAFAALLTEDLRSVNQDLHLRADPLAPGSTRSSEEPNWPRIFLNHIFDDKQSNFGLVTVKRFDGNIGYIELTKLKPLNTESRRIVRSAMEFLSNSDALIIDLRSNTGGTGEMTEFLSSYFFAEPVPLTGEYERATGGIHESSTIVDFYNSRLVDVPLYVLTSSRTISAPEGFAYNLQALGRATVIGETTRGAANPGRFFRIKEKIQLLVATGYAVNPLTGSNWEGTGVIPDIATTEEQALDKALEVASEAAEEFRRKKENAVGGYIETLNGQIADVETLAARDPRAAEEMLEGIVDEWFGLEYLNRYFFLELGDQYLAKGNDTMAALVFRQVPRHYPDYITGYRKLADMYYSAGDKPKALIYLTKMLELNPNDRTTLQRIAACQEERGNRP